ncbi:hypothetical protein LZ32DRAFT_378675 [Colletotrichum eremochloae]|nr:hypothetical protein LZ32DRAFT_378675 [Colletotrichum eremochloae]
MNHPEDALTKVFNNFLRARERERRRRMQAKSSTWDMELQVGRRKDIEQRHKYKHIVGHTDPPLAEQNLYKQTVEIAKPQLFQQKPNLPPFSKTPHENKDEKIVTPKRSPARQRDNHAVRSTDSEFRRVPTERNGKLWSPDDDNPPSRRADAEQPRNAFNSSRAPVSPRSFESRSSWPDNTGTMVKQPETRPISQEQLVAEVKSMYAGLVSKCFEVDDVDECANKAYCQRLMNEKSSQIVFNLYPSWVNYDASVRRVSNLRCLNYLTSYRVGEVQKSVNRHWYSKGNGPLVARGRIDGREFNALADTGAGYNLVSEAVAKRLGWDPDSSHSHENGSGEKLRLANSKFVDIIGAFEAVWKFASDPGKSWKIMFHIVRSLVHDAVLGKHFLMASETMTKHRHRLRRLHDRAIRTLQGLPVLSVNNIGVVTQRLNVMIVDEHVEALPDSGSEPNLLSLDYVISRGFGKLVNTNDIRMIQFADGTVQKTMGSVWLNWAYVGSSGDDGDDEWPRRPRGYRRFHYTRGVVYGS